jgi:hypothetical protein
MFPSSFGHCRCLLVVARECVARLHRADHDHRKFAVARGNTIGAAGKQRLDRTCTQSIQTAFSASASTFPLSIGHCQRCSLSRVSASPQSPKICCSAGEHNRGSGKAAVGQNLYAIDSNSSPDICVDISVLILALCMFGGCQRTLAGS